MSIPFFYIETFEAATKTIVLDEDNSRHVVQVLRMKEGEKLNLTDGKGNLINAEITDAHKKHCEVEVIETSIQQPATRKIIIAISLLKNANRFEWFLEKATEIGVSEIIPLICERTEKQKFRYDRMKGICISAMLQSQQCYLPLLHEPIQFDNLASRWLSGQQFDNYQKLIAHCDEGNKEAISQFQITNSKFPHSIILIGPEGDFTKTEINLALKNDFTPVSLGETRLRKPG
jgi:16S rRNA (uracil1498-N3)-methyltransferase